MNIWEFNVRSTKQSGLLLYLSYKDNASDILQKTVTVRNKLWIFSFMKNVVVEINNAYH